MHKLHFLFLISVFLCAVFMCFYSLGRNQPERWDEQTNAGVVSELTRTSAPWILTYNRHPFFEKPPLWYWITATITKLFGFSNFNLRVTSALSGFILIMLVYFLSSAMFSPAAGIISALILLSTGQLFILNAGGYFSTHNFRSADPDALYILFITLSYAFFYFAVQGKQGALIAASVTAALGFLVKGPLILIPFIIYIFYFLINGNKIQNLPRTVFLSLIIFLIIISPWYLTMISIFKHDFINQHLFYHVFRRITEPLEGHNGGWIFYLYLLTNHQVFPYSLQLLAGMIFIISFRNFRQKQEYLFPLLMITVILSTVFVMKTRLSWYVLGIYPFAALLLGGLITEILKYLFNKGKKRKLFKYAEYTTATALALIFISNIYSIIIFIL